VTTFIPGEIVNATINGARVISVHNDEFDRKILTVEYANDSEIEQVELLLDNDAVTVERVAPPEWPPQSGDLWKDAKGRRHFAVSYVPDFDDKEDAAGVNPDGIRVALVTEDADSSCGFGYSGYRPERVNELHGPMVLVYREDAQPGVVPA
jgi:hypothetical protein